MEIRKKPINENEQFINFLLEEHQKEMTGIGKNQIKEYSYAVFDKDSQVAGIIGRVYGNTLHIALLAVKTEFRKRSLGTMLINKLEEDARREKIKHFTVSTQEYQALAFYETLGFTIFGKLVDAPFEGTTKYYLEKILD